MRPAWVLLKFVQSRVEIGAEFSTELLASFANKEEGL